MAPCGLCGKESSKICGKCKTVTYCNRDHQTNHWKKHKKVCGKENEKREEEEVAYFQKFLEKITKEDAMQLIIKEEQEHVRVKMLSKQIAFMNMNNNITTSMDIINELSFSLHIETDKPPKQFPGMFNQYCEVDTKITKVTIPHVFKYGPVKSPEIESNTEEVGEDNEEDYELIELTEKQLEICAYNNKSILLSCGEYFPPEGKDFFTVRNLLDVISKNEEIERAKKENAWFGGVDCHHINFDGIGWNGCNYESRWSS